MSLVSSFLLGHGVDNVKQCKQLFDFELPSVTVIV